MSLLRSVVCCQGEVSATGRSLVQRSPTECACGKDCDREASMRMPWPSRAFLPVYDDKPPVH